MNGRKRRRNWKFFGIFLFHVDPFHSSFSLSRCCSLPSFTRQLHNIFGWIVCLSLCCTTHSTPGIYTQQQTGKRSKTSSLAAIDFVWLPEKAFGYTIYIFFGFAKYYIELWVDIYILEKKIRDVRSRETQNCNFQFRKTRNVCIYFFFLRERGKTTQEIRSATHREFIKFSY